MLKKNPYTKKELLVYFFYTAETDSIQLVTAH